MRYSPTQRQNETPELLQLAGELHKYFRAGNMKAFYATAEMVMRV